MALLLVVGILCQGPQSTACNKKLSEPMLMKVRCDNIPKEHQCNKYQACANHIAIRVVELRYVATQQHTATDADVPTGKICGISRSTT